MKLLLILTLLLAGTAWGQTIPILNSSNKTIGGYEWMYPERPLYLYHGAEGTYRLVYVPVVSIDKKAELKEVSAKVVERIEGKSRKMWIDSSDYSNHEIYRIDSSLSKSKWTEHPATQSVVVLVSLWREYKAECDSTTSMRFYHNDKELPLLARKKKPTAEGFLNWLSERIKK